MTSIEPIRPAPDLPDSLHGRLEHWREQFEAAGGVVPADPAVAESLAAVWTGSEFVAQTCIRQPELLAELIASGDLTRAYPEDAYVQRVDTVLADVQDEAGLGVALRVLRRREMVRIAWRDLAGWAPLEQTTAELSRLAEACIDGALARLHDWQCAELGTPTDRDGEPQGLVVLGMGKLGAWELNFSSDIDLIFAFAEGGATQGGARELSNEEFFTRLGRGLIKVLDENTAEGFVFRVDMRLRPFGDSGPLAMNFDAVEHYYQVHGREWERYAMIKARVVGGDRTAGEQLMAMLRPFVFRRYLDFGAFESLREMKQMIVREVARKGLEDNVKLGAGGIREVEFIAQAFQLIRGGREPALQERGVLIVLERLGAAGYLPEFVVRELREAYVFLRNVEHRLQEFADQQTHKLPRDEAGRARLAFTMGFADWDSFAKVLQRHRARAHAHFEQVFEAPQTRHAENDALDLQSVWLGNVSVEVLRASHSYRALGAQGRARMDRLMPLLLGAVGAVDNPDTTLKRATQLLESIARRTAYLSLLVENPMALSQLVKLVAASPWIAKYLGQHPLLLDELLDPRSLYIAPTKEELLGDLRERLAGLPPDDLELNMEALRHFKQANVLRVAAADLAGALPLMKVSDHLTWIAEAVVDEVLELAWRHMVERHGRPVCTADGELCDKGFAVVAYGKLGGIELGYGSDLDLVFLHGGEDEQAETTGEKPVALSVFFARLGQRIIHILTSQTTAGVLYDVDMRLRPSGASGLLVSGLGSFTEYQHNRAWTWEHQALVRARVVAGDPTIARGFEALRRDVLSRRREREALRREVVEMRERMREANSRDAPGLFDLKQGRGGIADIEFMVQYGVLSWACDHPNLLVHTDNVRLLAGLAEAGVIPAPEAELLADAYRAFRARTHRLTLQEQSTVVDENELADFRRAVIRWWDEFMLS
ncbi:MAG: bifunctional [glutamate--ammonia ligase]-adenylyl-L-tyrosine phosphorylase/[glutamate--ammonia-ligase] adenylyltransferase [Gammaproteobacteria bacterium]